MPVRPSNPLPKLLSVLACTGAGLLAGCGAQQNISYYGTAWVSVDAEPGPYSSYMVYLDSITLTRNDGVIVTAASTPEFVDLTQEQNVAELWSAGQIPDGIYTSATITLDYEYAVSTPGSISVLGPNGQPEVVTLKDAYSTTGATPTTYSITVNFDPSNQPNITPTYASTSAVLLRVNFDLAASGSVDYSTSPPTVTTRPFATISVQAPDTKLIRVRGPLINSSTDVDTYTVSIRPFYDEANNIGSLTLFTQPNTVWTLNGLPYIGNAGLNAISVLSAGTTITAGWCTFQTDYNALNGATAGRFNLVYVVAGSSLEDLYTQGLSGDVVARNGDTLTLINPTFFNTTYDFFYHEVDSGTVTIGPQTIVTADDNTAQTALTPNDIAVGQHITARGLITSTVALGAIALDSTSTQTQNTGSVRLHNIDVFGTLTASSGTGLTMNATNIDGFPISDFNFAGNGAAAVNPAAFVVNPGTLTLPAGVIAGDPLWVNGYSAPFGTAPPDFNAVAVNGENSVQVAGGQAGGAATLTPGTGGCGIASQVCRPAKLAVSWNSTTTPFAALANSGFTLNLAGATSATIGIGAEVIDLSAAGPLTVVPTTLATTSLFAPRYTVGNPATSTITATVTAATTALSSFNSFPSWVTQVGSSLNSSAPALQLTASGIYDRTSNTFTATSIDFVL